MTIIIDRLLGNDYLLKEDFNKIKSYITCIDGVLDKEETFNNFFQRKKPIICTYEEFSSKEDNIKEMKDILVRWCMETMVFCPTDINEIESRYFMGPLDSFLDEDKNFIRDEKIVKKIRKFQKQEMKYLISLLDSKGVL